MKRALPDTDSKVSLPPSLRPSNTHNTLS